MSIGNSKNMKIAFTTLPAPGHINPLTTLARRLQSRGHDVTFVALPFAVAPIQAAGLTCIPYCESEISIEWLKAAHRKISQLDGEAAVQFGFEALSEILRHSLDQMPATIAAAGIDALVMDATLYHLAILPMHL